MRKKLKKLFKDDLIQHTAIVFLGTTLAGVCSLLYHLVSVRLLTPEDYGTFNALISLIMFAPMAISPLGTALPRFFTEYITKKDFTTLVLVVLKLAKRLIAAGVVVFILFLFASSFLARFLKTKALYILASGGVVAFSFFGLIFIPLFQSFQKFKIYSLIGFSSSFGKLLIGALLMSLGWGVLGGLSGFWFSHLVIILVSLCFIPDIFKKEMQHVDKDDYKRTDLMPIYKYFLPVSFAMFSFAILTTIDVILVKHFFSPLDAGYYSIAQMVGKIALFLPSALAVVILPKGTKAYVENIHSQKLLYKSLFLGASCCLIFIGIAFIFPELLLKVLTGKANPASQELIGLFSVAMSFYALCWIVINFLLATHNLKFVLPLCIIAFSQALIIYFYHSSLLGVLWVLLFFSVITFLTNFFIAKQPKSYQA